jgi:hypothetical protein
MFFSNTAKLFPAIDPGLRPRFSLREKTHLFPLELSNCAKNSGKQVLELSVRRARGHVCSSELAGPGKTRSRAEH